MNSEITFVIATMVVTTLGQSSPSNDVLAFYSLSDTLDPVNLLDGPSNISHASTIPTINAKPTLTQIMYYNYWASAMYCQYQLKDLSCETCQKFKNDVYDHTVLMNNNSDCTAVVALSITREEIEVVFRGTMNIWNAVLDLSVIAVTYRNTPGVKLHAGFYAATISLYNDVVKNVGYLRSYSAFSNYKIVIVGHSLGGAMARLFLFFLKTLDQFPGAVYECYTYGEPRSGNKVFADYMNTLGITTSRVVSRADIVSHLAPVSVLGTTALGDYYYHCQTEFWIKDDSNEFFCNQTVYEDPNCSDSLAPAYSVADHSNYFDANYTTCILGQPAPWAAIPVILQPVGVIPPLPKKLSHFIVASANFVQLRLTSPFGG